MPEEHTGTGCQLEWNSLTRDEKVARDLLALSQAHSTMTALGTSGNTQDRKLIRLLAGPMPSSVSRVSWWM